VSVALQVSMVLLLSILVRVAILGHITDMTSGQARSITWCQCRLGYRVAKLELAQLNGRTDSKYDREGEFAGRHEFQGSVLEARQTCRHFRCGRSVRMTLPESPGQAGGAANLHWWASYTFKLSKELS
jgi:hypothetical protein